MSSNLELNDSDLNEILINVLRENQQMVVGLFRNEPGSWGFLAGQGVIACKDHLGRGLTDSERRIVWGRLWWWINQLKIGLLSGEEQIND
ncbi:MAG: hypothetical protein CL886_05745 [Dehalococcoidia bacterium]|nr:hypothetical protein [Dehalococcoidia bacterium]|tara:strand:- start:19 stop:288 length:270 start_codon:yes stop_codon:yes gene_type:complete